MSDTAALVARTFLCPVIAVEPPAVAICEECGHEYIGPRRSVDYLARRCCADE